MLMVFAFVLFVGAVGVGLYLLMIMREVPGAAEERFGTLEALPDNIGKWRADEASPEGVAARDRGEKREVRHLYDPDAGFLGSGKLLRQVRYRDATTNEITRAEPDEVIKRRRVRA